MAEVATLHERVCTLMRDGFVRSVLDVMGDIDAGSYDVVGRIMARLETEESLTSLRDPMNGRRMYVWVA